MPQGRSAGAPYPLNWPPRIGAQQESHDNCQIRLDIVRGGTSLIELTRAVERSNSLQEALWQQAKAMAAKDKGLIPTGMFIQSLNEMIDDQGKRLSALRNRIP